MKRLRRILRIGLGAVAAVAVVGAVTVVLVVRALVLPDSDKFGQVKDEASNVGLDRKHFNPSNDPYFVEMDKGVLKPVSQGEGRPEYPSAIVQVAGLLHAGEMNALQARLDAGKLTRAEVEERQDALYEGVRLAAVRGQNTWNVWTGGNDRFWDFMAGMPTLNNFDLLKLISSYPQDGRPTLRELGRWHYLGLVNEPCMLPPTKDTAKARFGLWLDRRDEAACGKDPFADAARYPGVETGARGTTITHAKTGETETLAIGSYYGEPTGILGLRLFTNPDFDSEAFSHWDAERYYTDPDYYQDPDLVRPYRVGMSCGFCHVGPSPVLPPPDPESPSLQHINSNPGAQYFWVDRIFIWDTQPRKDPAIPAPNEHNFAYQLFHTNPPGALDTSLVSTDYMNNPRTMNAVYELAARLEPTRRWGSERLTGDELDNAQFQDYGQTAELASFWNDASGRIQTARVLKDGADAVGVLGALNRVYANIGLFSEEWTLHFRPLIGGQKISPFRIADARRNSAYWGATEDMTADMAIFFLVTASADKLEKAKEEKGRDPRERYLTQDEALVPRGKVVFAENCAACHSSRIPPAPPNSGVDADVCAGGGNGPNYRECWDRYWAWVQTDEFKKVMTEWVLQDGFLDGNFLSTERRVPVDLLETNACGPLATNALRGDIWDNFSSTTYKELPPVRELTVHHPVSGAVSSFQPLGNGRGYTRPASLVSLWSTAPFLQNNSVGHSDDGYTQGGGYGQGYAGTYSTLDPPAVGSGTGLQAESAPGAPAAEAPSGSSSPTGYEQPLPAPNGVRCPTTDTGDPYIPCVDNRMRVFEDSIRQLLNPETRRRDDVLGDRVPGYMYRTTALSCVVVPKGFLPGVVETFPGVFNALADWAFAEDGALTLGPLPKGFPINVLANTKLLPDNDEPAGLDHYMRLARAAPTLYRTFKELGGECSPEALARPGAQEHAERVLRETGFIDTLVGLSKCPDYVVNRGHYFGADLPSADKTALIAFLKRL